MGLDSEAERRQKQIEQELTDLERFSACDTLGTGMMREVNETRN